MITVNAQICDEESRKCLRTILTVHSFERRKSKSQAPWKATEKRKRGRERSRKVCAVLDSKLMFSVLLLELVLKFLIT